MHDSSKRDLTPRVRLNFRDFLLRFLARPAIFKNVDNSVFENIFVLKLDIDTF